MTDYQSTEEFAQRVKVKAESIRHALCLNGHYLGIKPLKLPNGRLLWSARAVERILYSDQE